MMEHYFVSAWFFPKDENNLFYTKEILVDDSRRDYIIGARSEATLIQPSESAVLKSNLYVGPKLQKELEKLAEGLELTIDYGVLTFISKPLFWLLDKIYSFEAIPRTYNILKSHIQLNNCKKALLINKAISNINEKKNFYWTKLETGSASMKNIQNRKEINKVNVEAITFDSYFWKKKIEVDFIKCDVEGSELLVFQGATKYLKDYKPIIFCELLRKWSKKFNYSPNEVINLICGYGYNCYQLNKKLKKS